MESLLFSVKSDLIQPQGGGALLFISIAHTKDGCGGHPGLQCPIISLLPWWHLQGQQRDKAPLFLHFLCTVDRNTAPPTGEKERGQSQSLLEAEHAYVMNKY